MKKTIFLLCIMCLLVTVGCTTQTNQSILSGNVKSGTDITNQCSTGADKAEKPGDNEYNIRDTGRTNLSGDNNIQSISGVDCDLGKDKLHYSGSFNKVGKSVMNILQMPSKQRKNSMQLCNTQIGDFAKYAFYQKGDDDRLYEELNDFLWTYFLINTKQIIDKSNGKYLLPHYGIVVDFLPTISVYQGGVYFSDGDEYIRFLQEHVDFLRKDNYVDSGFMEIYSSKGLQSSRIKSIAFVCNGTLDPTKDNKEYYNCKTNGKDYLEQYELFNSGCFGYCGSYDGPVRRKIIIRKIHDFYVIVYKTLDNGDYNELHVNCMYSKETCIKENCEKVNGEDKETCNANCEKEGQCWNTIKSKQHLDELIKYNKTTIDTFTKRAKNL